VAFHGVKEKVQIFENGWVTLRTITIERPCYEMSISCTQFVSLRCVHGPSNFITVKANMGLLYYLTKAAKNCFDRSIKQGLLLVFLLDEGSKDFNK